MAFFGGGVSGGWAGELEKVTVLVFLMRGVGLERCFI